jgi:[acyl-carrier-protein] S-malonyltransferase
MGKIAFIFAGQGAQYKGMGRDLYENSPAAREIFDMAESRHVGTKRLCFEAEDEELSVTKNTQPALFAMDLACAAALGEAGIHADCAAGFSLGEVPAVAYAGLLSKEDAFGYVVKRGFLMHKAAMESSGAMAAVLKLTNEQVEALCSEFKRMYPVNYNCPGQVTVAGSTEEMEAFIKRVAELGGKAVRLAVSGAFHSPFMRTASESLSLELKNYHFSAPRIPVYSNVTALPFEKEKAAELMAEQVKSPVKWEQTIRNMIAYGVTVFIEVGAGKVLNGLIKKIAPGTLVFNADKYSDIGSIKLAMKELGI